MKSAAHWIQKFGMKKHIEGGHYCKAYQSNEIITVKNKNLSRLAATAIYYLLEKGDFSIFHRLDADELWHFYAGTDLNIYIITEQGQLNSMILGNEENNPNASFQVLVEKNCWFAAEPCTNGIYTLAGCTVIPGYDPQKVELANRKKLVQHYSQHKSLIVRLTNDRTL